MTKEISNKETSLPKLNQQNIPEMLEKVKQKIAEMSKSTSKENTTTKELDSFGKIEDIKEISTLIKAHSAVVNRAKAYNESASSGILPENVKAPAFSLCGHSEKQWVSHIESRLAEVANKKKLDGLKEFRDTLEENLSVEMKLASKLAKIQSSLEDWS